MKKIALVLCLVLSLFVVGVSGATAGSTVGVWGDRFSLSVINNFYNSLPGVTSKIIGSTLDVTDVSLLWAVQPADAYTDSEISTMQTFLSGGGRIAFMGEHGSYAPNENARIAAAVGLLGGHMTINVDYPDAGFHDATVSNGQILPHSLTAGVNTYNYACFASLNISGPAQKLMVGTDHSQVMMGYENIGAGSIFLITDQNVWDNVYYTSTNDNGVMFKNLLLAETHPTVPVPPSVLLLLPGLVGLVSLKKKLGK
jgi:hypothetical protein